MCAGRSCVVMDTSVSCLDGWMAGPRTRPLAFVPTTQGTPRALWGDASVRVRLRAAATQLDADVARALAPASASASSEPTPSPSPGHIGSRSARRAREACAAGADLERPMWGSPTPFHPSPLPLPRVADVDSLEARSRAFVGATKVVARLPRRRGVAQAGR